MTAYKPQTQAPHRAKAEATNRTIPTVAAWSQDQIDTIRASVLRHAPHDGHLIFEMLIEIDDE